LRGMIRTSCSNWQLPGLSRIVPVMRMVSGRGVGVGRPPKASGKIVPARKITAQRASDPPISQPKNFTHPVDCCDDATDTVPPFVLPLVHPVYANAGRCC
jgi:hypothetical protein